jgi:hypothetical protein
MTMRAEVVPTRSAPRSAEIAWTLFALAAGPAGWVVQLVTDYGLSSYACFPRFEPWTRTPPPGWSHEGLVLVAVSLACLVLGLSGAIVALNLWRSAARRGEGRETFLIACAAVASVGFTIALLFDTWPILRTPACWNIPA